MAQQNNKSLERKVRRSYFISTISIALVLFLLGSVGYLILNAISATDRMRESVTVYVMLNEGLEDQQINELETKLKNHQDVNKVEFVSKEQAAQDFKEYAGSDFEEFLDQNPLPNSFEVSLKAQSTQKEILSAFEKEIDALDQVDEVVYQRNVIEQITANLNKFNLILLLFGGTLFVISLILLNNTIRVTIFSKRYIINTMKLVGASQWFILKPFMGNAIMQGIYAAIIAALMFFGMIVGLEEGLPEIKFAGQTIQVAIIMGAMLVGGVLISLIFTSFAVGKFIRMQTNNIHLY